MLGDTVQTDQWNGQDRQIPNFLTLLRETTSVSKINSTYPAAYAFRQ